MSEELKDKVYATIKNAWNMVGILHEKPTLGDALDLATEKVMNEVVDTLSTENERLTKELEEIKFALQIEEHDNEYNCAERDKFKAENARLRALTEWQPIESCKGDGWYPVITKNAMGKNIVVMGFADGKDEDGIFWHDGGERFYPNHWLPLPTAPQIEEK